MIKFTQTNTGLWEVHLLSDKPPKGQAALLPGEPEWWARRVSTFGPASRHSVEEAAKAMEARIAAGFEIGWSRV